MRHRFLALLLGLGLAAPAMAQPRPANAPGKAGPKKPAPKPESLDDLVGTGKDTGDEATGDKSAGADKPSGGDKPSDKPAADDDGAPPPDTAKKGAPAKAGTPAPAKTEPPKTADTARAASPARPAEPPPRPTDDNDTTAVAAPPAPLQAVKADARPRAPGPYEMGALDCRMLDGAGIERILPERITAGEEPDLLCRIIVTQPPTVASAAHTLTLSVSLAGKVTYQQARNVRMSTVGRRALVFIIPSDRIASDEPVRVTVRATLSAPAKPATRDVKFTVESED